MSDKLIRVKESTTNKIGFRNSAGELIVPYVYIDTAFVWSEGMIFVKRLGWQGFLNEDGEEIICFNNYYLEQYEHPLFRDGLCRVSKRMQNGCKVYGFINKYGEEVCPLEFTDCRVISPNVIIASCGYRKELRCIGGHTIDLSIYKSIGSLVDQNHIAVSVEGKYGLEKWGCIDLDGNLVIPTKYDLIIGADGKRFTVKLSEKYGVVDLSDKCLTGFIFDNAHFFKNERCAVCVNNRWGFLDINSTLCIPLLYTDIRDFNENFTCVKTEQNKWILIDKRGERVWNTQYEDIGYFSEGLCAVKDSKGWGFINESGALCINCQFAEVESFIDGKCKVKRSGLVTGNDNPWGIIDRKGNIIVKWENNNFENITNKIEEVFTFFARLYSIFR